MIPEAMAVDLGLWGRGSWLQGDQFVHIKEREYVCVIGGGGGMPENKIRPQRGVTGKKILSVKEVGGSPSVMITQTTYQNAKYQKCFWCSESSDFPQEAYPQTFYFIMHKKAILPH